MTHTSTLELLKYLEQKHNLKDFLAKLPMTNIPGIFRNPNTSYAIDPARQTIFIINGLTGSGKDTIMNHLTKKKLVVKATTAVNRDKRPGEASNSYIWMRKQLSTESDKQYLNNLIKEYALLEYNQHHDNIYGLPRKSLVNALKQGPVIIRNEPHGAQTLIQKLGDQYNIIVLFILPDSWEQIYKRIHRKGQERDNVFTRLQDSKHMLSESKNSTHFYIHNTEKTAQYTSEKTKGRQFTLKNVEQLIKNSKNNQNI